MRRPNLTPADRQVGWASAAYVALLGLLAALLPQPAFEHAFSERGPFEQLSIVGWLLAALVVLLRIRPLGRRAAAFALLCALLAAREADWHKAFTADSLLKTAYYRDAAAPLAEKLLAGTAAVVLIALLVYVGLFVARFLLRQGGWRTRSGLWLAVAAVLVVLGKGIDRAPAVLLEEHGVALRPAARRAATALEEGLELLHPLLVAWSVWVSQAERRYLS